MEFTQEGKALVCRRLGETLRLEPWGRCALRVRSTMAEEIEAEPWALTETPEDSESAVVIGEDGAKITSGSLRAEVSAFGVLSFFRGDKLLLREYYRNYDGTVSKESRCLKLTGREWKGVVGGSEHRLTVRFESFDGEKLYGMGQYQQPGLRLPLEQSRRGGGEARQKPDGVDRRRHPADGLLDHRRGDPEGDFGELHRRHRPGPGLPGASAGPVAMQAALPHPGGGAGGGPAI